MRIGITIACVFVYMHYLAVPVLVYLAALTVRLSKLILL